MVPFVLVLQMGKNTPEELRFFIPQESALIYLYVVRGGRWRNSGERGRIEWRGQNGREREREEE